MARVTKEEKPVAEQGLTGIKEESEKGELFFKIVLMLMAIAFLGVVTYFVVDAIIGNKTPVLKSRYDENNYVLVSDVEKVNNRENFENISSEAFKDALDEYTYVYVLLFNENNIKDYSEGTQDRQEQALNIADSLMKQKQEKILTVLDEEYIYYLLDDDTALFFLDVSSEQNEGWSDLIDTSSGQASSRNFPALVEIHNGEDINWYGPWKAADKNPSAITKLNDILEDLEN